MGYYELKKSETTLSDQRYYFVLKAPNGEVIATSEMYQTKQGAENGILSIQKNGSTTDVRDFVGSMMGYSAIQNMGMDMGMGSQWFNPMNKK